MKVHPSGRYDEDDQDNDQSRKCIRQEETMEMAEQMIKDVHADVRRTATIEGTFEVAATDEETKLAKIGIREESPQPPEMPEPLWWPRQR